MHTKLRFSSLLLLLLIVVVTSGCARVQHSPDSQSRSSSHRLIAIAPPKVFIAASKRVEPAAIEEQQRTESTNFQHELYNWLVRRKAQNHLMAEVMDVATTEAKLRKAGYFDCTALTPAEICEVLDVDAIIISQFALSRPIPNDVALAVGLLSGIWGPTMNAAVSMDIHDRESGRSLWNFENQAWGSVGKTPGELVNKLMRRASRRMPYMH